MTDEAPGEEKESRGRSWLLWTAALLIAAVLLPLALALAAPGLASTPASPSLQQVPPLPEPGSGALPSLSPLFHPLPMVRPDPAGAADPVFADYQQARLGDAASVARVFTDAWHSLTISAQNAAALQTLEGLLVTGKAGQQGVGAGTAVSGLAAQIMPDLARDKANAIRLSDAAAALYILAWADLYGAPAGSIDGFPTSDPNNGEFYLPSGAAALLYQVVKAFPRNDAAAINLAFLDGTSAGSLLGAVLQRHPGNITARLLLSSSLARGLSGSPQPEAALAVLSPLLANPRTAVIGDAARGDVELSTALLYRDSTPFTARAAARRALDDYDAALRLTTDPGVYTGRATALDLLGQTNAAVATEKQAAARGPGVIGTWLLLSYLQEESGDIAGMRRSAGHALDLVRSGWSPPVSLLTYHGFPWTTRAGTGGYLRLSYAADADVFAIPPQGGGFLEVLNAIPRTNELVLDSFRDSSTGLAAIQAALAADVAAGDPAGATRDASLGLAAVPMQQRSTDQQELGTLLDAARIAAGRKPSDPTFSLSLALSILRDAGRFRRALAICRDYSTNPVVGADAEECAGEAQYFLGLAAPTPAGRLNAGRAALAFFTAAYNDAVKTQKGDPDAIRLEAAFTASQTAGEEQALGNPAAATADLALARRLYAAEAQQTAAGGRDVQAQEKLGDLLYQQGDLHGAIAAYGAVFTVVRRDYPHGSAEDPAVQAEEAAYNNCGISDLTLAQPTSQERPDCSSHRDLCTAAAADFRAALAVDSADPIALMNAGWAARLLGREEDARRLLQSATLADPSLYPAFNDLGVLSAEAGDTAAARRDFEAALAADPRYDLAAWNLGVLDMRRGLSTAIEGQAYLGRAIAENSSFRSRELEYTTDERIYRYVVGVDVPNGQALDRGYDIAAAALGWLTLIAALYATARHLLTDVAQERLAEFWDERLPELRERLVARLRAWLRALTRSRSGAEDAGPADEAEEGIVQGPERRRYPWWLVVPVLVLITLYLARRTSPDAILPTALLTLCATAIALITHEAGHRLVGWFVGAQVSAEHWGSSIPLAVVAALVPAETNMGPFFGHRVEGEESEQHHHWVYLGGPAANLVMAAVAYILFLVQPLPFFRLLAAVHLAVCAYALLPIEPLDGAELEEKHHIMLPLTAILTGAGVALALGVL